MVTEIHRGMSSVNIDYQIVFAKRHYASIVYVVFVSLCLSVTRWRPVKTSGWIELVFGMAPFLDPSDTVFYGKLDTSKNMGTSVLNIIPDSGLREKLCHSKSIMLSTTHWPHSFMIHKVVSG